MVAWPALLGTHLNDDAIARLRAERVADYGIGEIEFTCDDCPAKNTCEFAFDLYNTNGDCLAEK